MLPIGRDGDRLLLAMADPQDVVALDDVRAAVRIEVRPVVAERTDLLPPIERFVRADGELSELTTAIEEENDGVRVPTWRCGRSKTTRRSCGSSTC